MRWHIPLTALITDLVLFVPLYNWSKFNHVKRNIKLYIKGICIGFPCIVLLAGIADLYSRGVLSTVSVIFFIGMLISAVGDIVLEIKFIRGGICFALGHCVYIAGLFLLFNKNFLLLCAGTFVFLLSLGSVLTHINLSKKYRVYLYLYNAVVSAGFSLALPLAFSGERGPAAIGTGIMMLVISDWVLAGNKLTGNTFLKSLVALLLYFGGQLLIAAYPFLVEFI